MNSNSYANIVKFDIRALYLFAKYVLPRLDIPEQTVINELLLLLSITTQDLDSLIENNMDMFYNIYNILHKHVGLPPTLTNYAGIVLGKMEDILFCENDEIS